MGFDNQENTVHNGSEFINQIKAKGICSGDILLVVLFEGARYEGGGQSNDWELYWCYRGYYPPKFDEKITNKEGIKIIGFLKEVVDRGITLTTHYGDLFIEQSVVHSFTKLVPE